MVNGCAEYNMRVPTGDTDGNIDLLKWFSFAILADIVSLLCAFRMSLATNYVSLRYESEVFCDGIDQFLCLDGGPPLVDDGGFADAFNRRARSVFVELECGSMVVSMHLPSVGEVVSLTEFQRFEFDISVYNGKSGI
jgi:hypothetical protein